MANQPWDREVINLRERPLSSDVDLIGSYADQAIRETLRNLFARRTSLSSQASVPLTSGFIGSSFFVSANSPADMTVLVRKGFGFIDDPSDLPFNVGGVSGVNDLSPFKPLTLTLDESIVVPAADPVNPRIDIIEVKVDRRLQDSTSRDILDPGTGIFGPGSVNKTLSFNMNGRSSVNGSGSINYKTGTPAAVPVAPATSAGYLKIAEVLVGASVASIAQNKIKDLRPLTFPGGQVSIGVGADVNFLGVANGTNVSIQEISAPPGVLVLPHGTSGANGNVLHIAVIAGDTTFFDSPASIASCSNTFSTAKFLNTNPVGGGVLTLATLTDQTIFNAVTPSAQVAVGQPFLDFAFNVLATDGTTGITNPPGGTTSGFRLNISLGRSS